MKTNFLQMLNDREISKLELLKKVESDFNLVHTLLEGTASSKATIRYGCGSVLMDLSARHPEKLYPYMDRFIELLGSKHRILTWNAMAIIANLTKVDADGKFDAIFDSYYSFLDNEYMVTVVNVVANSAKIVANKPYLSDKIAAQLLKVQNLKTTPHLTEECKLVIAEHTIKTFDTLIKYTQNKEVLLEFAQKHSEAQRDSLRKEAQVFLEKWR
ncbi:MAG: hypothetical protein NWE98_00765 [Candidatus Bathyarchaeota archaeon]|nr:hypothetical protein [Candidatus Bathyarchaeota archaeon]